MSTDLARLLRIVADGREEYAGSLPGDASPARREQHAALHAEAAAFRAAAAITEGRTDSLLGLLPTWRFTPEVEELAHRVARDASPEVNRLSPR